MKRKDGVVKANTDGIAMLFKKNGVKPFHGTAKLLAANKVEAAEERVDEAVTSNKLCSELKKRESANLSLWLRARGDRL